MRFDTLRPVLGAVLLLVFLGGSVAADDGTSAVSDDSATSSPDTKRAEGADVEELPESADEAGETGEPDGEEASAGDEETPSAGDQKQSTGEKAPSAGEAASTAPEASAGDEAPSHLLRYDFGSNRSMHFDVLHSSLVVARKGEVHERTRSVTKIRKHLRVVSVLRDGTAILETMIDRVRMGVQFDDAEPVVFDSDGEAEPPKQFRGVRKKVGRPLARLEVDSRGKLISITPLVSDTGAVAASRELDAADNVLVEFPERPVRVGESWTQQFTVDVTVARNVTREAKLQRHYRLESVEDGKALVSYRISVLSPVTDPTVQVQLIQRTPAGKITFDLDRGLLLSRTQALDEEVFGPFGPGSTMHAITRRSETLEDGAGDVETADADAR